jgi:O-antigen ligase
MREACANSKQIYNIIALGTGILLGVASILFAPLNVLIGLAALGFLFVLIRRPEIGLLGYLVITATLINGSDLPRISLGVGRLLITDVVLLILLGQIIVQAFLYRDYIIVHTPLDFPLLAFVGIALFSTGIAIIQSRLTIQFSLGQIRSIISYLTFFVVTNQVRQEKQLRTLLRGMLVFAIVVSLAMIAQFIMGSSVQILPGRVEILGTEGVRFAGVTRIIPPGESLIFPALIVVAIFLTISKLKPKNIPEMSVLGLIGLAVVLTFKRNLWFAVFLALFLLALLGSWRIRLKVIGGMLLIVMLAIIIFPITSDFNQTGSEANRLIRGVLYRLTSLTDPQTFEDPNSSLRWRDFEYQYAIPQINLHPIIGSGLGAIYRPYVIGRDREESVGSTFIHNGHLDIIVKSGILGYFSFFMFSAIVLVRGFKLWLKIPDPQFQAVFLGFTLAYLGILIGSIVSPMIVTAWWTPVIGIMAGINEVILTMDGCAENWNFGLQKNNSISSKLNLR